LPLTISSSSFIATTKVTDPHYAGGEVTFPTSENLLMKIQPNLQLLGAFQIKEENKKSRIEFYNAADIREAHRANALVDEYSSDFKEEDIYLIVRSLKNKNNENKGYKLSK
jgi:hypothetical protein